MKTDDSQRSRPEDRDPMMCDPGTADPKLRLLGQEVGLPRSRWLRTVVGVLLVFFGLLGFLPVLGFWMVPLGLVILANDFPAVRRFNRRAAVWFKRTWQRLRPRRDG